MLNIAIICFILLPPLTFVAYRWSKTHRKHSSLIKPLQKGSSGVVVRKPVAVQSSVPYIPMDIKQTNVVSKTKSTQSYTTKQLIDAVRESSDLMRQKLIASSLNDKYGKNSSWTSGATGYLGSVGAVGFTGSTGIVSRDHPSSGAGLIFIDPVTQKPKRGWVCRLHGISPEYCCAGAKQATDAMMEKYHNVWKGAPWTI